MNAQVAELVDALVSNTNEVTLVPVRSRPWVLGNKKPMNIIPRLFCFYTLPDNAIYSIRTQFNAGFKIFDSLNFRYFS